MVKKERREVSPAGLSLPGTIFLIFWILGIVLIFCQGRYLDGRTPRFAYFVNFVDLIFSVGHAVAVGLGWNIFLAVAIWFIFLKVGNSLFRGIGIAPNTLTATERVLLSSGLGSGIVSVALLVLGLAGHWSPVFLRVVFLIGTVIGLGAVICAEWRKRREDHAEIFNDLILPAEGRLGSLANVALVIIAAAIALNLLASAAPEIFYDSLVYHLALPKLYLLNGRILPTPQNLYSGLPFGMEMLYGLALALSNEHLAVLLHCSFGWAAALALGNWLRRYSSKELAIFGVLNFVLCPVVLAAGWQCGVDLGTVFYFSLALIAISQALHAGEEAQARRWSVIAGILLGFAFSTKYTALPLGAAFILTHGWLMWRADKSLRDTMWMAAVAATTFAPWLLRNFFFYGDPFYPFLHHCFGSVAPAHWDKFLSDAHAPDLGAVFGSFGGWKTFLLLPWNMTIDRYFDYRIGLVYLLLLPGLFLARWGVFRKDSTIPAAWTAVVALASLGYFLWCVTSTITRFLMPTLLLASGTLTLVVGRIRASSWLRQAVWLVAIGVSLCNFTAIYLDGMPAPGLSGKWAVLRAQQSQADYLKRDHVGYGQPYYAAMDYINQKLPQGARVVFLGEPRGYYCERNFIAATVFDYNPFWIAARDAKSSAELHDKLKSMGVTHVFLNVFQLYSNAAFSAMLPQDVVAGPVFSEFWTRYLHKAFEDKETVAGGQIKNWLVVYELLDGPAAASRTIPDNPILDTLRILRSEGR